MPPTTWSARRLIDSTACTNPIDAPEAMPMTAPSSHEPVRSAPKMPKKAPISIMPSSPMLITPLRSDSTPPRAAKVSGVAKRSIAAINADHTKTSSRFPTPDRVATTAPIAPTIPATIAP